MSFLEPVPDHYEVCEVKERVVAAFVLMDCAEEGLRLNRIMIDMELHL